MKYVCVRTSKWWNDYETQPCDEAVLLSDEESVFRWFVEINSIEELNAFVKKYGDVIVSETNNLYKLEIYDDNRE